MPFRCDVADLVGFLPAAYLALVRFAPELVSGMYFLAPHCIVSPLFARWREEKFDARQRFQRIVGVGGIPWESLFVLLLSLAPSIWLLVWNGAVEITMARFVLSMFYPVRGAAVPTSCDATILKFCIGITN